MVIHITNITYECVCAISLGQSFKMLTESSIFTSKMILWTETPT